MEKESIENGKKEEPQLEEMDSDFLKELNELSKQLKTDDELLNDYKAKNSLKKLENNKIIIKPNGAENNNINNNITRELENINELFDNNNLNENPFKEAYNIMNSKQTIFDLEENDLLFKSLDSINSDIFKFNSILSKTINLNNKNEINGIENKNEINEIENNILGEILDFLIQSNLLKDTIFNMKKSIEKSLEKNKNNLKKEENEKYKEAILNAEIIINEANKIKPDKNKIMDSLKQLQQISNDIDSISFI